jgi:two-component system, response regulator PdtaR
LFSDKKLVERIAPKLKRALLVDPNAASARLISEILRETLHTHIFTAPTTERALKLAGAVNPDIVFVEYQADQLDGLQFTRSLRRSNHQCRKAPVIMVTQTLLAARDAGVHEFLCKPFSFRQLMRRLEAVSLHPRDWVEAMGYIGPDRRRFNSGDYHGPRKRREDGPQQTDQQRIEQALKILRGAVMGLQVDPEQAIRSMEAQAECLQSVATFMGDAALAHAAKDFQGYLAMVTIGGGSINQQSLERNVEPLLRYLPPEDGLREVSAA